MHGYYHSFLPLSNAIGLLDHSVLVWLESAHSAAAGACSRRSAGCASSATLLEARRSACTLAWVQCRELALARRVLVTMCSVTTCTSSEPSRALISRTPSSMAGEILVVRRVHGRVCEGARAQNIFLGRKLGHGCASHGSLLSAPAKGTSCAGLGNGQNLCAVTNKKQDLLVDEVPAPATAQPAR